ncbi:hypothetical protein ACFO0M_00825 [Micromonospora mangrovi]|uniref:Uncharacterized protein n=2 Tax=Micromonospora TaxID=1873 RepID=A0AAU8HJB9_9ACTN
MASVRPLDGCHVVSSGARVVDGGAECRADGVVVVGLRAVVAVGVGQDGEERGPASEVVVAADQLCEGGEEQGCVAFWDEAGPLVFQPAPEAVGGRPEFFRAGVPRRDEVRRGQLAGVMG